MFFHSVILTLVAMFFALAATEKPISHSDEDVELCCSCKKKKRDSFKEMILVCADHEEPLEEEV